jgi:hypothetical protein
LLNVWPDQQMLTVLMDVLTGPLNVYGLRHHLDTLSTLQIFSL